ncbi:murein L,D-transpeptidase catalytic domain-containing protein [Sphingobacterium sp.]|uniref:murein L,D-transpeptidase catalytic domain-containing protein n=1 Tax=Sphingobacterium sp. TaxID=341027 RepID=UPI0031E463EA
MNKFFTFIILVGVCLIAFRVSRNNTPEPDRTEIIAASDSARYNNAFEQVKNIVKNNKKYNKELAFLLDMKRPSGRNRFFVVDLRNNQLLDQGLVAHGSGSETGKTGQLKFSNKDSSYATSLGMYAIGVPYNGRFGKAYRLFGLEDSNSNAYNRNIVLHKYDSMPYDEQVAPICLSQGCPMVNVKFYERLQRIIDTSQKQIILSIYY